jgi:HEAT repeat protein
MRHTTTQPTVAELSNQLNDPDYRTRVRAAIALGNSRDSQAISALLEALSDYDYNDEMSHANTCATEALAKIGAPALMPLLAAFQERHDHPNDVWRRSWVADALGMLGDPRALEALTEALEDLDVCAAAAEALGRIGDIRALEALERLLPVSQATAQAAMCNPVAWAIRRIRELHSLPILSAHEAHRDLLERLLGVTNFIGKPENAQ